MSESRGSAETNLEDWEDYFAANIVKMGRQPKLHTNGFAKECR